MKKGFLGFLLSSICLVNCNQGDIITQKSSIENTSKEKITENNNYNKSINLNVSLVTEKNDTNLSKLNIKSLRNNNFENYLFQINSFLKSDDKKFTLSGSFNTSYFEYNDIYYGRVSINGSDFKNPLENTLKPNPFPFTDINSTLINLNADTVPKGKNRIVTIYPLDKEYFYMGKHLAVMGVVNIDEGKNIKAEINWNTTPTAKVIQSLIDKKSKFSDLVDHHILQNSVNTLIDFNTPSNKSDDIHPSLVDTEKIANFIIENNGQLPSIKTDKDILEYRLKTQTIKGKIEGISYNIIGKDNTPQKYIPLTKVICNDPASKITTVTDPEGNFVIEGVTPGKGYTLKVVPEFHNTDMISNVISNSENIKLKVRKEHYLEHSVHEKYGIMRFDNRYPINVQLILPNNPKAKTIGFNNSHKESVIKSLEMWEHLSDNKVKFKILPDIIDTDKELIDKKLKADIYIEWTKVINLGNTIGVVQTFPDILSGSIPPLPSKEGNINFNTMPFNNNYKVSISLATHDYNNKKIPESSLTYLSSHEIGHALGLAIIDPGTGNIHPKNDLDAIMYPSVDFLAPTNLNVGLKDLNTLKFLYDIPANITTN